MEIFHLQCQAPKVFVEKDFIKTVEMVQMEISHLLCQAPKVFIKIMGSSLKISTVATKMFMGKVLVKEMNLVPLASHPKEKAKGICLLERTMVAISRQILPSHAAAVALLYGLTSLGAVNVEKNNHLSIKVHTNKGRSHSSNSSIRRHKRPLRPISTLLALEIQAILSLKGQLAISTLAHQLPHSSTTRHLPQVKGMRHSTLKATQWTMCLHLLLAMGGMILVMSMTQFKLNLGLEVANFLFRHH